MMMAKYEKEFEIIDRYFPKEKISKPTTLMCCGRIPKLDTLNCYYVCIECGIVYNQHKAQVESVMSRVFNPNMRYIYTYKRKKRFASIVDSSKYLHYKLKVRLKAPFNEKFSYLQVAP